MTQFQFTGTATKRQPNRKFLQFHNDQTEYCIRTIRFSRNRPMCEFNSHLRPIQSFRYALILLIVGAICTIRFSQNRPFCEFYWHLRPTQLFRYALILLVVGTICTIRFSQNRPLCEFYSHLHVRPTQLFRVLYNT